MNKQIYILLSIALLSGSVNISAGRARKNKPETNLNKTVHDGIKKTQSQKAARTPASKQLTIEQVKILENYNEYGEFLKKHQNETLDLELRNEFTRLDTIIQNQNNQYKNTNTRNGKLNRYAQINLEYMLYLHGVRGPIDAEDFIEHKKLMKELFKS